jgi:outer membrane receptor protein involved in Fe transport
MALFSSGAWAVAPESGDVVLHVVVRAGGAPLAGARVAVVGFGDPSTSGPDGRAAIAGLSPGRVSLRVTADGYRPVETTVTLSVGPQDPVEFALDPAAIRIDESVIVVADRQERAEVDTPRSTTVIGRTVLDERAARTTPEARENHPGGWVQKTDHGGGAPFFRGLVGNQILVLIDGIRLNNATFRLGPNQYANTIDSFSLERIEVLRGSGSVAYGSDAIGGAVNLVTTKPSLSPGGVETGGAFATRLAGQGMEASVRADGYVSGRALAARGGVTYRAFGDLVAGGDLGTEAPSAYEEADVDGSVVWAATSRTRVTGVFQNVHQFDVPRYDQVAQRGYEVYSFVPQIRRLGYVEIDQRVGAGWLDSARLTASWHRSEEGRVRRRSGSVVETRESDVVSTLGLSVDLRGRVSPWLSWSGGFESYDDVVRSWRKDTNLTTGASVALRGLYPDGSTRTSLAGFLMGTAKARRLTLDVGARYTADDVQADDPVFGPASISPSAVTGSVAAGYALTSAVSVFGSVAQAFRAPNIDDLSTLGAFDYGIEVPPVGLNPERSLAIEGGAKVVSSRVSAAMSVFRIGLRDLIDRIPATLNGSARLDGQDVYTRANIGEGYVQGLEAEFEWRVTRSVSVSGFAATTYGRQAAADIPLRRIPPTNSLLSARYLWRRGSWAEASVRAATKQDRLAPGDVADHRIPPGGTPGWVVANISAGVPVARRLELSGGVANVFNEAYRVHGSGVDGPGRHVWLSARVLF